MLVLEVVLVAETVVGTVVEIVVGAIVVVGSVVVVEVLGTLVGTVVGAVVGATVLVIEELVVVGTMLKVAAQPLSASIVTRPSAQSACPFQPSKAEPVPGVAVRLTSVPLP